MESVLRSSQGQPDAVHPAGARDERVSVVGRRDGQCRHGSAHPANGMLLNRLGSAFSITKLVPLIEGKLSGVRCHLARTARPSPPARRAFPSGRPLLRRERGRTPCRGKARCGSLSSPTPSSPRTTALPRLARPSRRLFPGEGTRSRCSPSDPLGCPESRSARTGFGSDGSFRSRLLPIRSTESPSRHGTSPSLLLVSTSFTSTPPGLWVSPGGSQPVDGASRA